MNRCDDHAGPLLATDSEEEGCSSAYRRLFWYLALNGACVQMDLQALELLFAALR